MSEHDHDTTTGRGRAAKRSCAALAAGALVASGLLLGAGAAHPALAAEAAPVRQAERLDRAPVAVATAEGVYVGWRMLGLDPDDVAFDVYRDGRLITPDPVTDSTDLVDAGGTASSTYRVEVYGSPEDTTEEFGVEGSGRIPIPIQKPADTVGADGAPVTYSAGDGATGDLDGDGALDIVLLWTPSNAQDNSRPGVTGEVFADAYRMDGTRLWRIALGPNIRAGAHYTQPQVFDYDGDGRAEVIMKTADGTVDALGTRIGDASDHRADDGYVLDGPEYLTLFDGESGTATDTVPYVPPRGDVASWGDDYGNRVDRFLSGTAYLDGEHPTAIFSRGYYTRTVIAAWDVEDDRLVERWVFDSDDPRYGEAYEGQGNHNLSVADVDGDARDEIVFGSMTIDDDGEPLYNTGLGHGDAMHLGDLDPSRPGLEVVAAHEDMVKSGDRGATYRDAATGEVLYSIPAERDTGRAAAGDIDPAHPGSEWWAVGGTAAFDSPVGELRASDGELIGTDIPAANFLAWWDADPLREIVDQDWNPDTLQGVPTIEKWDPASNRPVELLRDDDSRANNGTKGTPVLQADLLGDWREEIVWRSADSTELRVYTTTDDTELRLRTLMHDPVYRLGVAWQSTAYNQPPHPSFFLGDGMTPPPAPSIRYAGDAREPDGATAAPAVAQLSNTAGWTNGLRDGTHAVRMDLWWGENATEFRLYENGALIAVRALDPATPQAQRVEVALDGRPNGTYRYTGVLSNSRGETPTGETTVEVTDALPGAPSLFSDAWRGGRDHRIVSNLWWGTNADRWTLYENDVAVDAGSLIAATPARQSTATDRIGRAPGEYVYRMEYTNRAGTTSSAPLTITVAG